MKYAMKKKSALTFFIVVVSMLIILTGCASKKPPLSTESEQTSAPPMEESPTVLVELTDSGFSPAFVTIKAGQTVKFENKGAMTHWPASDVHPAHSAYPGSGIQKCKTTSAGSIFDACHGLNRGEAFAFTFNEKGVWHYHDHLDPGTKGTITVE